MFFDLFVNITHRCKPAKAITSGKFKAKSSRFDETKTHTHANNMLFDGISDLWETAAEIQFFCIVTSSFSHPACVSSEFYAFFVKYSRGEFV